MDVKSVLTSKKFFPIFLIIICSIIIALSFGNSDKKSEEQKSIPDPAADLESRLERVLSKVDGAGKVSVFVSLDDYGTTDYVKDSKEVKQENQTQTEQKTVMEGSGQSSSPIISKMYVPKVKGIVVVAQGASNESVKEGLFSAVESSLAIKPHRITILTGNN